MPAGVGSAEPMAERKSPANGYCGSGCASSCAEFQSAKFSGRVIRETVIANYLWSPSGNRTEGVKSLEFNQAVLECVPSSHDGVARFQRLINSLGVRRSLRTSALRSRTTRSSVLRSGCSRRCGAAPRGTKRGNHLQLGSGVVTGGGLHCIALSVSQLLQLGICMGFDSRRQLRDTSF